MNIEQLMSNPLYRRRKWTNIMMLFLPGVAIVVGLFWLAWIMWTLFSKGLVVLSPALFTQITPPAGETGGGFGQCDCRQCVDGAGGDLGDDADWGFGRYVFG